MLKVSVSYQAKGQTVDCLFVSYDHVESVLVVHDGPQAHDTKVDVIGGKVALQLG